MNQDQARRMAEELLRRNEHLLFTDPANASVGELRAIAAAMAKLTQQEPGMLPEASPATKGICNTERACRACYSGQGTCEVVSKSAELALRALVGNPEDPNIGWRGVAKTSKDHFSCEMCGMEDLDCTKIPHTLSCPVPKAIACVAGIAPTPSQQEERKPHQSIHIGEYEIRTRTDGSFWIEHDSGEGMQVTEDSLHQAISDYYRKTF